MQIGIPVGLRYMAYGAFWFSIMSLFVKLAGRRLHSAEIVFVRALITLVLSYMLVVRAKVSPRGHHQRLLILRGLLGFLALTCFYYSIVHLPLAEATVIQYANPMFAAILAASLLGERLGLREIVSVIAGLAGVVLLARPAMLFGGASAIDPLNVLIALAGAAFSAAAYVTVRRLGHTEHPLVIVFYFTAVSAPVALPFAIPGWLWPTPMEWLILIGVGVATQAGQVYITRGLQLEPAGRATAVGYLQVVFATLWGFLVFSQRPDIWTYAGAAIVIAGTLGVTLRKKPVDPDPAAETALAD